MAVAASIRSPVSSICMARFGPIDRVSGTIGVEQNRPMRTPGVAKRASVVATARSQLATSWHPAAVATPCTWAITGCGIDCTVVISGCTWRTAPPPRRPRRRELGEVVPGGERGAGPGDDDDSARRAPPGPLQLPHEVERQRVAPLGAVERDPGDRLDVLDQEVLPRAHSVDGTPGSATAVGRGGGTGG